MYSIVKTNKQTGYTYLTLNPYFFSWIAYDSMKFDHKLEAYSYLKQIKKEADKCIKRGYRIDQIITHYNGILKFNIRTNRMDISDQIKVIYDPEL